MATERTIQDERLSEMERKFPEDGLTDEEIEWLLAEVRGLRERLAVAEKDAHRWCSIAQKWKHGLHQACRYIHGEPELDEATQHVEYWTSRCIREAVKRAQK